jgi:hypothetical protein
MKIKVRLCPECYQNATRTTASSALWTHFVAKLAAACQRDNHEESEVRDLAVPAARNNNATSEDTKVPEET